MRKLCLILLKIYASLFQSLQIFPKYFFPNTYVCIQGFNSGFFRKFCWPFRLHRGRSVNPSCLQIQESFKTLIIRGTNNTHSVSANCEDTFEPLEIFYIYTHLYLMQLQEHVYSISSQQLLAFTCQICVNLIH